MDIPLNLSDINDLIDAEPSAAVVPVDKLPTVGLAANMSAPDFVTILTSKGARLTKRIFRHPNGRLWQHPYENAKNFAFQAKSVGSLKDLRHVIDEIGPQSCLILGRLKDGIDATSALRRLKDHKLDDGTTESATVEDVAHYWLPMDIDSLDARDENGEFDPIAEPARAVQCIMVRLPVEFQMADCIWQFTSSAGFKPGIRMRLYFWLSRPLTGAEMKAWLDSHDVIDKSIYTPVQPIYAAPPVIEDVPDPVSQRSGILYQSGPVIPPEVITVERSKKKAKPKAKAAPSSPAHIEASAPETSSSETIQGPEDVEFDGRETVDWAIELIEADIAVNGRPEIGKGSDNRTYALIGKLRDGPSWGKSLEPKTIAELLKEHWAPHFDLWWLLRKANGSYRNDPGVGQAGAAQLFGGEGSTDTSADRSKAIFKVIAGLVEHGLDDVAILNLISAHPEGIGEKYADRNDLNREVARVRAKTQTSAPTTQPATRPVVQIRAGALPLVVDKAEQHLIEADPKIFQRGSVIVRPVQDFIPTMDGKRSTGTRLIKVGIPHLIERFLRVIDFQRQNRQGVWFSADCPRQVAETYLGREGDWKLPVLTRIISAPTLRADGSILEEPGYDEASGLFFDPQGLAFPPIASEPHIFDVIEATNDLLALLASFPFVDNANRAVALSAILTALIRPSLPAAPLHAFTAPVRGSGKSLLVDSASMIASGHEASVIAQGHTAEEFEKRLGACFLAGDAIVAIDNCERSLEGDFLCQVLTQRFVTIRELGHSRNVTVPTNASLFATGNNLQIKGDLTRRTIVCALDPECERPELRVFTANPLDLIRRDRARYVTAALTLLRYAAVNQLPSWATPSPLGSFEEWSGWVRAATFFATDADPCATMARVQAQDPEAERLIAVMYEWAAIIGDQFVTTSELIEIATKQRPNLSFEERRFVHDTFREALLVVAGMGGNIDSRRLGSWLGHNKDRIVGGRKIVMGPMSSGFNQWQVVTVN